MKIKQRPNFGTMPLVILGLVYIHTFLALLCSAIDKLVNNVNLSILSIQRWTLYFLSFVLFLQTDLDRLKIFGNVFADKETLIHGITVFIRYLTKQERFCCIVALCLSKSVFGIVFPPIKKSFQHHNFSEVPTVHRRNISASRVVPIYKLMLIKQASHKDSLNFFPSR